MSFGSLLDLAVSYLFIGAPSFHFFWIVVAGPRFMELTATLLMASFYVTIVNYAMDMVNFIEILHIQTKL